ncbi:Fe-S cluster assembly factor HCF101 [Durusdinium trenchii]|uniref:Chloroplastic (Protein HIGH CHLOROPHYLL FLUORESCENCE 101) n=1 Tax=Durusdinium trenchii TaxID=1381693 RepID=A0ABP0MUH0_9DINO
MYPVGPTRLFRNASEPRLSPARAKELLNRLTRPATSREVKEIPIKRPASAPMSVEEQRRRCENLAQPKAQPKRYRQRCRFRRRCSATVVAAQRASMERLARPKSAKVDAEDWEADDLRFRTFRMFRLCTGLRRDHVSFAVPSDNAWFLVTTLSLPKVMKQNAAQRLDATGGILSQVILDLARKLRKDFWALTEYGRSMGLAGLICIWELRNTPDLCMVDTYDPCYDEVVGSTWSLKADGAAVMKTARWLGRWSAQLDAKLAAPSVEVSANKGAKKAAKAADSVGTPPFMRPPAQVQCNIEERNLVTFVRQLPSKPLVQRGGGEVHSTAKLVLLCASGKGGVGKSTVSVNLAYMMKQMGFEVALLDLDIYGPSLPELVRLPPNCVTQNEAGRIIPIDYGGVALMSWGYINPGEASTIRAPIANQIVGQLLTGVEWGPLDILIIDSPPGTGDVLLSIAQTLSVDGSVLVTTSNSISLADVDKGLQLFTKVEIEPLLVVRNMASVCCEECQHEQPLFMDSAMEGLSDLLSARSVGLVDLPLDGKLSQAPLSFQPANSLLYPFVRNPHHEARAAWRALRKATRCVLEAALGLKGGTTSSMTKGPRREAPASLRVRPGGLLEVRLRGGDLRPLSCGELRANCRCALCVDEMTGEVKIDQAQIREDLTLKAKTVEQVGNYAVSVVWSDGHQTLVALRALAEMVGGQEKVKKSNW